MSLITVRPAGRRGWTRQPEIAEILQQAIERFIAVFPWASPELPGNQHRSLEYVMLTAAEVLTLDPWIPVTMSPEFGHNDGPSWNECVVLANEHPDLLFAGFLMPPTRADEGIDLDAIYIPEPDVCEAQYIQAITRADSTRCHPDEDSREMIDSRAYRRLWWD
jgi:hypothetical protein